MENNEMPHAVARDAGVAANYRENADGVSVEDRSIHRETSLSDDGVFANGVTAATVIQFIVDHDEAASIKDVAAWFHLSEKAVVAALGYYGAHSDRLRASGEVVRP